MYSTTSQTGFSGAAKIVFTEHFLRQAATKGFTADQIKSALRHPYKVTDVTRYPGQKRYCGKSQNGQPGVAVVMDGNTAITCYLDGVITARRSDQNDAAALNSSRLARLG